MKPVAGALLLVLIARGAALPARAAETPESLHQRASAVEAQLEGEIKVPGLKEPVEVLQEPVRNLLTLARLPTQRSNRAMDRSPDWLVA